MGDLLTCSGSTNDPGCYVEQWANNATTRLKQAVVSLTAFVDHMTDVVKDARESIWSTAYAMPKTPLWRSPVPVAFDTNSVPDVTRAIPVAKVEHLTVRHDKGIIQLIGTSTDTIDVRAFYRNSSPTCTTNVTVETGSVTVETRNAFLDPGPCEVDVVLFIPSGLAVAADVRKGSLYLNDLSGSLALKVGLGKLWGEINSSEVDVRAGLGELFLRWTQMPSSGDVDIRAGATDTTLEFPRGAVVAPTVHSGLSDVKVGVATNPAAAFKVQVRTGLADLRMRYSQ